MKFRKVNKRFELVHDLLWPPAMIALTIYNVTQDNAAWAAVTGFLTALACLVPILGWSLGRYDVDKADGSHGG